MNDFNSQYATSNSQSSKLFIVALIIFLSLIFFQVDHNINFTRQVLDSDLDGGAISQIRHGDIYNRIALVSLAVFCGILLLFKRRTLHFPLNPLNCLLLSYLFWIFLSFLWAEDSALVARRIVVFSIVYFAAFVISESISFQQLSTIVMWITALFLMIGIYTERALGTWWLGSENYRFAGTYHPEGQAINCAMLILAAASMAGTDRRILWAFSRGMMLLGGIFLYLTKSRGPFVGLIVALLVYQIYTKRTSKLIQYLLVVIVISCVMLLIFGDVLFEYAGLGILLGREDDRLLDLNGRRELWIELLKFAEVRPIGGFGFGGFWTEDRARTLSDYYGWTIESSHSIYLETLLETGVVGLTILIALLISAWTMTRRILLNRRATGTAFAVALLALWMVDGILSTLVVGRGFVTFLLFVVLFGIARGSPDWAEPDSIDSSKVVN